LFAGDQKGKRRVMEEWWERGKRSPLLGKWNASQRTEFVSPMGCCAFVCVCVLKSIKLHGWRQEPSSSPNLTKTLTWGRIPTRWWIKENRQLRWFYRRIYGWSKIFPNLWMHGNFPIK
jgi:hypothetical protein